MNKSRNLFGSRSTKNGKQSQRSLCKFETLESRDLLAGDSFVWAPNDTRGYVADAGPTGYGWETQGVGVAMINLDNNPKLEIVTLFADNPVGDNSLNYRIGWNVDAQGQTEDEFGWAPNFARAYGVDEGPQGLGDETAGAGVAFVYLDDDTRPEMITFFVDDPNGENELMYRIGWNIGNSGTATGGWTPDDARGYRIDDVPFGVGEETSGAGIAITNLDSDPRAEMIMLFVDNPDRGNTIHYRIGWNLDESGEFSGGTTPNNARGHVVGFGNPGVGWETQGAGVTLGNLDDDPRQEIIASFVDNPNGENTMQYRIGWNIDSAGVPTGGWTPGGERGYLTGGTSLGSETQGAGIAMADLNGDSSPDLVAAFADNPERDNSIYYRVARSGHVVGLAWGEDVPREFAFDPTINTTVEREGSTPAASVPETTRIALREKLQATFSAAGIDDVIILDGEQTGGFNVYFGNPIPGSTLRGKAYTGIDQFNADREGEAAVFLTGDLDEDLIVLAHEVGHLFGLRHVNPDATLDPHNVSVMDYFLNGQMTEAFVNGSSAVTEPPRPSGTPEGYAHNPVYHLERYVDNESHTSLVARGVTPGEWDLQHASTLLTSNFNLDFTGEDRNLYNVKVLVGQEGFEGAFREIDAFESTSLSALGNESWTVNLGDELRVFASSSSALTVPNLTLASAETVSLLGGGVRIAFGDANVSFVERIGGSTSVFATGTGEGSLLGDAGRDGKVSFSDFLVVSANFGRSGSVSTSSGDFDNDDDVDFADFLILAENFGESIPRQTVDPLPGLPGNPVAPFDPFAPLNPSVPNLVPGGIVDPFATDVTDALFAAFAHESPE